MGRNSMSIFSTHTHTKRSSGESAFYESSAKSEMSHRTRTHTHRYTHSCSHHFMTVIKIALRTALSTLS